MSNGSNPSPGYKFKGKKMKIYFARPQSMYSSPQDLRDLRLIKTLFLDAEIIDPNTPEHQQGFEEEGMGYVLTFIHEVDLIIFRAFPGGKIGAGVWKEIQYGLEYNADVLELPVITSDRALSPDDTREYLRLSANR